VARRFLQAVQTVLLSTLFVFFMLSLVRGGASASTAAPKTRRRRGRRLRRLGLDKPLLVQYFTWLGKLLTGDMGTSWRFNQPVLKLISNASPCPLNSIVASIISIFFSSLLGVFLAVRQNSARPGNPLRQLIFISARSTGWRWRSSCSFRRPFAGYLHRYVSLTQDFWTHLQIIAIPSTLWGICPCLRSAALSQLRAGYLGEVRAHRA
jgi:peptide/nickel transport system permease protein